MAATLRLEIVTPEAQVFSEDVDMVTLPGIEGEMGIYPMHVPLLTEIKAGEVTVRRGSEEFLIAVGNGFAEITATKVALLADMAIKAEDIDEAKAEEARRRAEARLAEKLDGEEAALVTAALTHSLALLNVKRRQRK